MFKDIFEQYSADESVNVPDQTNINQVIIYYDDQQLDDFKRLSKEAMRKEFPQDFQQQNLSTILLKILKKHYGTETRVETQNAFY